MELEAKYILLVLTALKYKLNINKKINKQIKKQKNETYQINQIKLIFYIKIIK